MNMHAIIHFLKSVHDLKLLDAATLAQQITKIQAEYSQIAASLSAAQKVLFHALLKSLTQKTDIFQMLNISYEESKSQTEFSATREKTQNKPADEGLLYLAQLAATFEPIESPEEYVQKLQTLCGDLDNMLLYLQAFSAQHKANINIFQEACAFKLPKNNDWTVDAWKNVASINNWNLLMNTEFRNTILPVADKLEAYFREKARTSSVFPFVMDESPQKIALQKAWYNFVNNPQDATKFQKVLMNIPISLLTRESYRFLFVNAEKNIDAAIKFKKLGLDQEAFDRYLQLTPRDSEEVPTVIVKGDKIGLKDYPYYIKKIASDDPIAAGLGMLTACCQSLGTELGTACVEYGIQSPLSGFYVLCKGKGDENDPIVAQAWAFSATAPDGKVLVLDSIESAPKNAKGKVKNTDFENIAFWKILYLELARKLVAEHDFSRVMLGYSVWVRKTNRGVSGINSLAPVSPVEYSGSRDSHEQIVLATKEIPLSELYILQNESRDFPGGTQAIEDAKKRFYEWVNSEGAFNKMATFIQDCTADIDSLDIILTFRNLLKGDLKKEKEFEECCRRVLSGTQGGLFLCLAVSFKTLEEVQWLVDLGADVNRWNAERGNSPLLLAAKSGELDIVKYLVENQANVRDTNDRGNTALHLAAKAGALTVMQWLHQQDPELLHVLNAKNNTALHLAARHGELQVVQWLMAQGLDPMVKNKDGDTALHLAAQAGNLEIVQWLNHITHGAYLTEKGIGGNTPLHLAIYSGHLNLVKWLVETQKKGFMTLDAKTNRGNTALALAIERKHWEVARYLIEQGADVNINGAEDKAPVILAVRNAAWPLVQYLLEKGANVDAIFSPYKGSPHKESLLSLVVGEQQWDIAKYLIEKNAHFDLETEEGQEMLRRATEHNRPDIVELLEHYYKSKHAPLTPLYSHQVNTATQASDKPAASRLPPKI